MAWFWTILISLIIILLWSLHFKLLPKMKQHKKNPPSPKALPLLGHLHLLGPKPHQDIHRLAQKHGPIMLLRFGLRPTFVVSSPSYAELALKTHGHVFVNKATQQGFYYISYGQRDIAFGPYGPYWRSMRKLVTVNLVNASKIVQFRAMRRAELWNMVGSIRWAGLKLEPVDLSAMVSGLIGDMTCLMVFGRKYDDGDLDEKLGFKGLKREALRLMAVPNFGDFFPFLRKLDLQGLDRRMKELVKTFDGFLERIIDEHREVNSSSEHCSDEGEENYKERSGDFVDTMMGILESGEAGFEFNRRHVKAVLLNMLFGATDSSSSAIESALSELIKHPYFMTKLQNELQQVVGMDKRVEEPHLNELPYLDSVVKETFRLHPPSPLLIHESVENCTLDGYYVAKGSRLIINTKSIGRDPSTWEEAEVFNPERFVGRNVDVWGQDFELLPFGSGRRGCPAMQLGLTVVKLVVAQLVHCFDWELPDGLLPSDLDMEEHFGLVVSRERHLKAIPKYRLLID